jgi:putative ABC transport system permease protein
MSYWKIAWRNMQQRALASSLTGLSMALGVALMVLVLVIHQVVVGQLSNDAQGYNFIVAGKGSPYEIVLTTVFHVGRPIYPIPYKYYKKFVDGEFAPYTDLAVPICLGDSYVTDDGQVFRVVGTTPEMFEDLSYGAEDDGTEKYYQFEEGRNFKPENFFEAVLGSVAANRTGLKVGDQFRPSHGISGGDDKHDQFTVVGVLAPTGTANDRAMFVNIEGFYLLDGHARAPKEGAAQPADEPAHDEEHADSHSEQPAPLPEAQREVTSILVRCKPDLMMAPMAIEMGVNKGEDLTAQAVAPVNVVERLQSSFLAPMRLILLVLTVLIVVVAGIGILVSIYNSMSERSHDIAVMRALGASRTAVMAVILVESILLALLGGVVGLLIGHGVLAAASPIVEYYTGIMVRAWNFTWQESWLVPGLVAFAALVGFLPALSAYRTDVARTLSGSR